MSDESKDDVTKPPPVVVPTEMLPVGDSRRFDIPGGGESHSDSKDPEMYPNYPRRKVTLEEMVEYSQIWDIPTTYTPDQQASIHRSMAKTSELSSMSKSSGQPRDTPIQCFGTTRTSIPFLTRSLEWYSGRPLNVPIQCFGIARTSITEDESLSSQAIIDSSREHVLKTDQKALESIPPFEIKRDPHKAFESTPPFEDSLGHPFFPKEEKKQKQKSRKKIKESQRGCKGCQVKEIHFGARFTVKCSCLNCFFCTESCKKKSLAIGKHICIGASRP